MRSTIQENDYPQCQNEEILYHMLFIGPVSSIVAIREYGITRLAARIHYIKKEGFDVQTRRVVFTTRHDKKASYNEYFFKTKP